MRLLARFVPARLASSLVPLARVARLLAPARTQPATAPPARDGTELRERNRELEETNRELDAFCYSISHELRAPLRTIAGFARILIEEHADEVSGDARRYLGYVQDGAREMAALIDDLIRFSRLSAQPLGRAPTDPAAVAREALACLGPERDGRRVDVIIGRLPECLADPALLKRVYVNLLSNALKFTRGREVARIEVGAQLENGQWAYYVRDNGVGFEAAYAERIFEVFQRLGTGGEYEGTGVGLALVQRIVRRHGGRAWAEGEPGRGATLYFTLCERPRGSYGPG